MKIGRIIAAALLLSLGPRWVFAAPPGYRLIFDSTFRNASSVDLNNTGSSGFQWYLRQFNNDGVTSSNGVAVQSGALVLGGNDPVSYLGTASPAGTPEGWVGTAFGGGAYFEARIAFDPGSIKPGASWPAFWAMAIEHLAGKGGDQWFGGERGYVRFEEDDFFEYDTATFAGPNSYGAAIHEWYGIWNVCRPKSFCSSSNTGRAGRDNYLVTLPENVKWTAFHTIGQLWVPSNKSDRVGYVENYFDGRPVSRVEWRDGETFSAIDSEHLVVFLSVGKGQQMKIRWVRVWQNPDGVVVSK